LAASSPTDKGGGFSWPPLVLFLRCSETRTASGGAAVSFNLCDFCRGPLGDVAV
jgi:hypothetical protein